LIKGDLCLRLGQGGAFKEMQEECTAILSDTLLQSKLYERYGNRISQQIFDNEEYSALIISVCGTIENRELFQESRGKEKWRMFVSQTKKTKS